MPFCSNGAWNTSVWKVELTRNDKGKLCCRVVGANDASHLDSQAPAGVLGFEGRRGPGLCGRFCRQVVGGGRSSIRDGLGLFCFSGGFRAVNGTGPF